MVWMLPGLTVFGDPTPYDPSIRPTEADMRDCAYWIDEPAAVVSPVVFASPHSGRIYPKHFLEITQASTLDLRRIEDAYVDRLLADVQLCGAPLICGLFGRAFIDLNRSETEMDPLMFEDPEPAWFSQQSPRVEAGLGCIPRVAFNGAAIYRTRLRRADAEKRLEQVYRPYHRALEALLKRAEALFGRAWLIDCHSMPTEAEGPFRTPDVVIGDRFGASCSRSLVELVEEMFRARGYRTARNTPYAGGYSTVSHGTPALGRQALQIEIHRRLYLDEARVEPHDGFPTLRVHMGEIAEKISAYARAEAGSGQSGTKKKAAPDASAAKVWGRKRP